MQSETVVVTKMNSKPNLTGMWSPHEAAQIAAYLKDNPLQQPEDMLTVLHHVFPRMYKEDLVELATEWFTSTQEAMDERARRLRTLKEKKAARKLANRGEYIPAPLFIRYETEQGKKRWIFEETLRSRGLLALIVEGTHGSQEFPPAMAVQLKTDSEDSREAMLRMREQGYAISGGRLAIYRHGPGWTIATKAFPKAIWFSAYVHGLVAPILPDTYVAGGKLTFAQIEVNGRDLQTDGSGIYHPQAPEVQALVAKYGLVPFQIRALNPEYGIFAKGVVFPSHLALDENGNPTCKLDWNMIKGRWKDTAMERRKAGIVKTIEGMHWGALQVWNRRTYLSATFELLEVIRRTPRTEVLIKRLIDTSMRRLIARGVDGVAADVAKNDETLTLMMKIMSMAAMHGMKVHPMQIPRFKEAIMARMDSLLYATAVGAGFRAPIHVARLDATIPPGCAVVAGYEPGMKVATYRFPMILSQGAVTVKVIAPPDHLLVDGELTAHTIVMNPADLVLGMQGDDDGDFLGVTDDPAVIELFENRLDNQKFRIEPKGIPVIGSDGKELMVDTDEGMDFVMYDQRGPVGQLTMWRSALLAVGDNMGATALSILIQEAIDQAKRRPEWTDWRRAADLANWTVLPDGTYRCDHKLPVAEYDKGTLPLTKVRAWVQKRLVAAGSMSINAEGQPQGKSPLWWRQLEKVEGFKIPEQSPDHENLVHVSTRHTLANWQRIAPPANTGTTVQEVALLPTLLLLKGVTLPPVAPYSAAALKSLRNELGLSTYASRVGRLPKDGDEVSVNHRIARLVVAQTELEDTLREKWTLEHALNIWTWEMSGAEKEDNFGPNVNNAWRVVAWSGSPIFDLLGIEEDATTCRFLHQKERLSKATSIALQDQDPYTKLAEMVYNGTLHQQEVFDTNGNGVAIHECPTCSKLLYDNLVSATRARAVKKQTEVLLALHERLRG